ncbi:ATP synthase I [Ureibacillus massiliensis 4400831 = CIP 108448 = CCUG 49529]|uniref:ATP synthase I n=1 Tax=Ureibacillus massiliensis 4400831 = CIP 108448 = CCUG 49529 TaxID=1211035 RepID=A0A0A3J627_9BACL|nr:ATP synthase subunit I [Ureibacillus massiliensis]KGR92484.1 ATP synthase I [Ureibacillus massiliensis 4400831 = CIP 108448 = CCUG 49529]BDH60620.1 ATP synthase protein I [Lysinibacillus sp. PLM2]
MLDLHHIFAMQKKALFFLFALSALGWGFTSYQSIFLGISLGAFFGTYNFWILVRRMDKFDRNLGEGKRTASLGTALRFGSGVAAVAIAITLPEYFHLISTVTGLMIPYVFLIVGAIVYLVKNK